MIDYKLIGRRLKYCLKNKSGLFYPRFKDQFYAFQQDKFRGSFTDIKEKLRIYIPYIKKVSAKIFAKHPFLDVGFGRGEFLELLKENAIKKIIGVDTHKEFVKQACNKNFTVFKEDIIKFLYLQDTLYSGISAFHVVEHLSFPQLFDFLFLCRKKLVKGGIFILETPNIENIMVSSQTFYFDHTHIQKIPHLFIQTVLEFLGFSQPQFLFLHPRKRRISNDAEHLLFGPQDLGIIAYA